MKNTKTYYQLILDRSGSMQDCIDPTISGYNEQIQMIMDLQNRYPEQEIFLSLTQFNHFIDEVFAFQTPDKAVQLNHDSYQPHGSTALLDAIGSSVNALNLKIGKEVRDDEASVVVVILTDGYENASRQYSHKQISSMIKELEATGRWTFSYIGATADAVEVAASININRTNSMSYDKAQTANAYRRVNRSMDAYMQEKSKGRIRMNYLVDDEEEQKKS